MTDLFPNDLSPRERLHRVLGGQLPDRFPLRLVYGGARIVEAAWGAAPTGDPAAALRWHHERHDTHGTIPGGFLRPIVSDDGNHYLMQCETGAQLVCQRYPTPNQCYTHQPIQERADLARFRSPDPHDPRRYEGARETIELHHRAGCYVAVHTLGPFQGTNLMLRPFAEALMDFYEDPDFAYDLHKTYTDFYIEDVCHRLELGADGVTVCDDLGFNQQMMIPPDLYRRIVKPLHRELIRRFKQFPDVKVYLHCDGCVRAIMDDLIEVGFDGLDPLDASDTMLIEELKPLYGDRLTLAGGFDRHVGQMTEDALLEHVARVVRAGKPGGRYIAHFSAYPELTDAALLKVVRLLQEMSAY